MIQNLRDAINNGKTSGEVQNITITYSIPDLEPILVDHPRTEGVKVLPGTYITANAFEIEVLNSFTQWSLFINELYNEYVVLNFEKVVNDADITIDFDASLTSLHMVDRDTNTLKLNLGINWTLIKFVAGTLLLNYVVYGVGKLLGMQNTTVLSPMSFDHLNIHYVNLFDLNISESGHVQKGYLKNYSSITTQTMLVYGDIFGNLLIYGCTDPTAQNYNPDATASDFSCIPFPVNPDLATRDSLDYYGSHNQYFLYDDSNIYAFEPGLFESPMSITDINDNNTSLPLDFTDDMYYLTSLVITDKAPGTYGDSSGTPRYYVLLSATGSINIFNKDAQLLSGMPSISLEDKQPSGMSYYSHNTNINYQVSEDGENHFIYWLTNTGKLERLKLSDGLPQVNSQGQTVAACDLDTYTHGNVSHTRDELPPIHYLGSPISDNNGNYLNIDLDGKFITDVNTGTNIDIETSSDEIIIGTATRLFVGFAYQPLGNQIPAMGSLLDPQQSPVFKSKLDNLFDAYPNNALQFTVHTDIDNLKTCFIPTIDGVKALSIDLYANFLHITNISQSASTTVLYESETHAAWVGDLDFIANGNYYINKTSTGTHTINEIGAPPSEVDYDFRSTAAATNTHDATKRELNVRNTNADCHPYFARNAGQTLLRPFSTGFSFSNSSIGLLSISGKQWSKGEFAIGDESRSSNLSLFASLPITLGNKLFRSYFCDTTKISYVGWAVPKNEWDADIEFYNVGFNNGDHEAAAQNGDLSFAEPYNALRHVGDFHLAIAVKHGFVLTKVNNTNFSLVSPTTENGLELHVCGGNPSMENFQGGWTPVSMQFSPDDNYLYTIIQNPTDSSDLRIAIYNIHPGGGEGESYGCTLGQLEQSISNDAKVVDMSSSMDLVKVTLQDDGCIYFWGGDNDYLKITDPDLQLSVDLFRQNPQTYVVSGQTYIPSKSYLHNNLHYDLTREPIYTHESNNYSDKDSRIKYAQVFNSKEPAIGIGEGITLINNFEYNSKFIGSGFTFDSISNKIYPNVELDNVVSQAAAVQTANNVSLGIVAYVIENDGQILLKGYDGTVIDTAPLTGINYDFKDSVFITSSEEGINDYIYGYASDSLGSYVFKTFRAFINIDNNVSYTYELNENSVTLSNNSVAGYDFIPGARIIKADTEQDRILIIRSVTDTIATENKKKVYLNIAEYTKGGIEESSEVILVHSLLQDKLTETASAGARSSSYSISGVELYTTIAVNRDNTRIAIGTMSKSSNHLHTVFSLSVYQLDITQSVASSKIIGNQIGNTLTGDLHLVENHGPDSYVGMTDTIIRGLEFTNITTTTSNHPDLGEIISPIERLYCLVGKHGSYTTNSVESLSKSNRLIRFKVSPHATEPFRYDGPTLNQNTFAEPEGLSSQNFTTFTDGFSDQGNSFYENNSAPIGMYLGAQGDIFISNIIPADLYKPGSENERIIFIGGYISNANSGGNQFSNARLFRTACVKAVFDDNRSFRDPGGFSSLISSSMPAGNKGDDLGDFEDDIQFLPPVIIPGCTDPNAVNYNPYAQQDDGSCIYGEGVGNCNGICTGDYEGFAAMIFEYDTTIAYHMILPLIERNEQCGGSPLTVQEISQLLFTSFVMPTEFTTFKNPHCNCSCVWSAEIYIDWQFGEETGALGYGGVIGNLPWYTNMAALQDLPNICSNTNWGSTGVYYYLPTQGYYNAVSAQNVNLGGDPFVQGSNNQLVLLGGIVGGVSGTGAQAPGYANFIHSDDWNPEFCRTCTDATSPNYVGITPEACVQADQFCFDDPAYCGMYGCTDPNACNYIPNATVDDGSCQYAPSGTSNYGVNISTVCGCPGYGGTQENGFSAGYNANMYCGGCSTPEQQAELKEKGEYCNCDGTTVPIGNGTQGDWGVAHYCDCEGSNVSDLSPGAGGYGCICDENGNLSNYSTGGNFPVGICDCYGNAGLGPGCSCGYYNSQDDWDELELLDYGNWCDCNTPATLWYPKNDQSYTAH